MSAKAKTISQPNVTGSKAASNDRNQWGFDYGLSAKAAVLSSIEFNNNLRAADVIAVAYGVGYSTQLSQSVPTISLVGRNEKPLRLAFEEFSQWAESCDGDAVDLTYIPQLRMAQVVALDAVDAFHASTRLPKTTS